MEAREGSRFIIEKGYYNCSIGSMHFISVFSDMEGAIYSTATLLVLQSILSRYCFRLNMFLCFLLLG